MRDVDITRRITLRELRLFVTAARSGSMSKAASDIGLSQPALSRCITELERTLGVLLFDRTNRGISPTPHGEVLLRRATGVLEELRHAVDELRSLSGASGGDLRIGGTPTMCAGLVPAIMNSVLGDHPQFRFEVAELDARKLAGELAARSVDIGIGAQHAAGDADGLVFEELFDDRLFIVAAARHPLVSKRSIKLEDVARMQWVLPGADAPVTVQLRNEFRKRGLTLSETAVTTMSISVRYNLIGRNNFLTVVYGSALRLGNAPGFVRVLPIDLPVGISIGILRPRGRTLAPSAEVFAQAARRVARQVRSLRAKELQPQKSGRSATE